MTTSDSTHRTVFDIAGHLETELASLKTGIRMMLDELAVRYDDPEAVEQAVSRLYFIGEALDAIATRFDGLKDRAYELATVLRTEQPDPGVTIN
jgi:hypothetical protein